MSTDLVEIEVPGATDPLHAAMIDGKQRVALRPLCDIFRCDYGREVQELSRRSWTDMVIDERIPQHVMISERTMTMWLAGLDENEVPDGVRDQLIAYQREAANALDSYFNHRKTIVTPPLNAFDALRAVVDQLEVTDRRSSEALSAAKNAQADVDAMMGRHDWVSGLGYCRRENLPTYERFVRQLGIWAAELARQQGITPVKVQHSHYGLVNSFPLHIWAEAAEGLRRHMPRELWP